MKVVWHCQSQTAVHVTLSFTDGKGFLNGLPDYRKRQLAGVTWGAADCNEIDIAFGVGRVCWQSVMRQMLAADVVHADIR